ncbi:MAG: hypothetical protein U0003_05265 [Vampirovibrionales bacterium]
MIPSPSSAPLFAGKPPLATLLKGIDWANQRYDGRIKLAKDAVELFEKNSGSMAGFFQPDRFRLWSLNLRKKIATELLSYDFVSFSPSKIGPLKAIFATPPKGALVAFAYIGLEVARAKRAWERSWIKNELGENIKRDFREIRDILIRDTWSIAVYIWGLPIFNKVFLDWGSRQSGIRLSEKGAAAEYKYSEHTANRSLGALSDSAKRSIVSPHERYLANMLEGSADGMVRAARSNVFLGIPRRVYHLLKNLGPHFLTDLDDYAQLRKQYVETVSHEANWIKSFMNHPKRQSLSKEDLYAQAMKKFQDLNGSKALQALQAKQDAIIKRVTEHSSSVGESLAKAWSHRSEDYLARAAKWWTTAMGASSFAVVLVLIGWLPVAYNAWYTKKEYEKYQSDQGKIGPLLRLSKWSVGSDFPSV